MLCWCHRRGSGTQREEQGWRGREWLDFVHVKFVELGRSIPLEIDIITESLRLGEQSRTGDMDMWTPSSGELHSGRSVWFDIRIPENLGSKFPMKETRKGNQAKKQKGNKKRGGRWSLRQKTVSGSDERSAVGGDCREWTCVLALDHGSQIWVNKAVQGDQGARIHSFLRVS